MSDNSNRGGGGGGGRGSSSMDLGTKILIFILAAGIFFGFVGAVNEREREWKGENVSPAAAMSTVQA